MKLCCYNCFIYLLLLNSLPLDLNIVGCETAALTNNIIQASKKRIRSSYYTTSSRLAVSFPVQSVPAARLLCVSSFPFHGGKLIGVQFVKFLFSILSRIIQLMFIMCDNVAILQRMVMVVDFDEKKA
jgi:hypothetical protein